MTNQQSARDLTVELPSGARMPLLGFGTWQLEGEEARKATRWALEAGYRHIDTATGYGNQTEVGAALKESGVPREEVFVTTKLPPNNAGREHPTLEESLTQLDVDYLDLWLIHWPPMGEAGVPTWREFITAQDEGLVRDIGVSNYSVTQLDELTEQTGVTPAVNQIPWDPTRFDAELLAAHRERGVVLEGYSPFRKIKLTDPTLVDVARKYGKTVPQIILRWHLEHEIVVIPKSAQQERIRTNADIFDFELDPDDVARIDGLSTPSAM